MPNLYRHAERHQAPPFFSWVLALFGTAVGAGILFLPIQAGQGGFLVLGVAALLVWPTIAVGHRLYALIPSRAASDRDFSAAVGQWMPRLAPLLRLLFVVWLLILLVAYAIALTNDLGDLLVDHVGLATGALPRPWLALAVLLVLMALVGAGRAILVRLLGGLSLVLIGLLLIASIALAPHWRWAIALAALAPPTPRAALVQLLVLYPLLTLSFMFFPSLSAMVLDLKSRLTERGDCERVQRRIIIATTFALMGFVLAFVVSFMLALPASAFATAERENISALALAGDRFSHGLLSALGPAVSLTALTTSFIGIYLGYRMSVLSLLPRRAVAAGRQAGWTELLLATATAALIWPLVVADVPVMAILGDLVAPLGAIFLLLVPSAIVLLAADFRAERGPAAWFSGVAGLIVITAYFVGSALGD